MSVHQFRSSESGRARDACLMVVRSGGETWGANSVSRPMLAGAPGPRTGGAVRWPEPGPVPDANTLDIKEDQP